MGTAMPIKTAVFGGGCFWCTEAVFRMIHGIINVESGYAGGRASEPSYEQVSTGKTGHAEVVRITYDSRIISYDELLTVFFAAHDPTTLNRQGADEGEQYRSIILYQTSEEEAAARARIQDIQASLTGPARVVTQVVPLEQFYKAEAYHQDYFAANASAPYCRIVIEPKIEKIQAQFAQLLKKNNGVQ